MNRTVFIVIASLSAAALAPAQTTPAPAQPPDQFQRAPAPDFAAPDLTNPHRPYSVMVGDEPPPLAVKDWLLGDPVEKFEPGKVYVVHFWAVWCEPCIEQMGRLTALQNRHAQDGLVVLGVTSRGKTNTIEAVRSFVFQESAPIGYTIGWDPSLAMIDSWVNPAGASGFPCLFIIDGEGKIAYIGQWAQFERTLADVLAGGFDREAAAREYIDGVSAGLQAVRVERLIREKDYLAAYTRAAEMVSGQGWNHYPTLANIAWAIVDPKNTPEVQDLNLALRAAERASELTGGADPDTLDTLARVHFARAERARAIEIQKKAVELAIGPKMKQRFAQTLAEYEAAGQ